VPEAAENPGTMKEPTRCAKCQSLMEEGFILDLGDYNSQQPSNWISGPPERSFWQGTKTKGKRQRQIRTFRCIQCGFLESYAW
jgi:hypothetical protein